MIPSDDEDGTGHRCSSHASSSNSQRVNAESIPSTAAMAAATWRAFNRPRMALAVLAVSLQHIAAHSDHLQYRHNCRPQDTPVLITQELVGSTVQQTGETDKPKVNPPALPILPVPVDVPTSSLDEGIEPDR